MPASKGRPTHRNHQQSDEANDERNDSRAKARKPKAKVRRTATLYDAVAGKIGLNGFLTLDQLQSKSIKPSTPEEVLLRRVNAPDQISYDYYNADEKLNADQKLPDSDLLKDIHAYVSDFYEATNDPLDTFDFRSLDETALLAMGILLEEACKEAIGESGDMVFTEPQSWDQKLPGSLDSQRQVEGMVVPKRVQEYQSSSEDEEAEMLERLPRKRRRRGYRGLDD
ncbi:hypothetical protein PMZ80_004787 [Knufia obscura]|uniref:Uncharacterized protein n=2 Tax=Knufia TaxID=430999 RepID=A0AAN8EV09_9EURO|nr:hypothetical protein PMZ80_004787 [Knufia obscura]KAK5952783.1 hypothetical protein OHC33_006376 [Knufia fluminis]